MPSTIELTARQLYQLGKTGSVKLLMPPEAMTCYVGCRTGGAYHIDGTDVNVVVTDTGTIPASQVSLTDIQEAGFETNIPSVCKDFSPTEKQKEAYRTMTAMQKDEFIQNLARHRYMGWCDVADKVFARFTDDWKRRYPGAASTLEQDDGKIMYAVLRFDRFD